MDFKAGVGVSQSDVDGISAIFITYFHPAGYTMVERTQIDKVIEELGFQRSKMTQSQMVRMGEILNVSKIVVGDVNVAMGQYNLDVRVVNVETGTIAATDGDQFTASSYRSTMQKVAERLASKIAVLSNGSTHESMTQLPRTEPYLIYGYLKVFPHDLGVFASEPKQIIERLNQSQKYGYGTWRLPTNEELSIMRSNNVIGSEKYMTKENSTGVVRLVTDKEKGEVFSNIPEGFVDLGLPSGTLWADENLSGDLMFYREAAQIARNYLPSKEQFEELINYCNWKWIGSGYKVVGSNGNFIILPAEGYDAQSTVYDEFKWGAYWSSQAYYGLTFREDDIYMDTWKDTYKLAVRLVINP